MFYNKLNKGVCKQMGSTRSGSAVNAAWSPCGRHLMTATTAPRLRVDNNVRIFTYTGEFAGRTRRRYDGVVKDHELLAAAAERAGRVGWGCTCMPSGCLPSCSTCLLCIWRLPALLLACLLQNMRHHTGCTPPPSVQEKRCASMHLTCCWMQHGCRRRLGLSLRTAHHHLSGWRLQVQPGADQRLEGAPPVQLQQASRRTGTLLNNSQWQWVWQRAPP